MCDRDKVINGLESTMEFLSATKNMFKIGFPNIVSDVYDKALDSISDAIALLKEYDDALKLMVYQYCTMKHLTADDDVFHNKFMSAGEAAFRLLGLENGQSIEGVWERWFPNG